MRKYKNECDERADENGILIQTEREKLKWQQGDDTTAHCAYHRALAPWKFINNLSPPDSFNSSERLANVYAPRLVLLHVDTSTCPIQNIYHTVLRRNERLDEVTTEERRYRVYISCTRFPSRLFDGKWCLSTKELLLYRKNRSKGPMCCNHLIRATIDRDQGAHIIYVKYR